MPFSAVECQASARHTHSYTLFRTPYSLVPYSINTVDQPRNVLKSVGMCGNCLEKGAGREIGVVDRTEKGVRRTTMLLYM